MARLSNLRIITMFAQSASLPYCMGVVGLRERLAGGQSCALRSKVVLQLRIPLRLELQRRARNECTYCHAQDPHAGWDEVRVCFKIRNMLPMTARPMEVTPRIPADQSHLHPLSAQTRLRRRIHDQSRFDQAVRTERLPGADCQHFD